MNQLKAGAILNYVIIGLNSIVGLAYTPYMLRCLGQSEYGLYSLVASVIAYLTILDFGFGNAIVRYTAKFRAEGKSNEQWYMFGMFLIVYFVIGIVALCGGLALYFNVDILFNKTMSLSDLSQARTMMMLLTLNLTFTFPLSIFGAIITAYENFVFQRVVNIARIIITTCVMIGLLYIGYKAVALVVVQTLFNLLTLVINYVYCRRKLKIKIYFGHFDFAFLKEIGAYSFWIFLSAIVDKIYWGTGQFVLGATIGTIAVAVFSIAILFQQMYVQFSAAIANVLLPRITSMVSNGNNNKEISRIFISTGRIQALILTLILSGFIIFGKQFICLWADSSYEPAFCVSIIFFSSLYIPLIQNTGVAILQARNQLRFRSVSYVIISIVSLCLQVIMSKLWGVTGCAVAIGGCLIIGQGIVMNIYYYRVQNIDIPYFWKSIVKMSLMPCVLTAAGVYAVHVIAIDTYLKLFSFIILYLAVYIPVIFKWSMNSYERELILIPINRVLRWK